MTITFATLIFAFLFLFKGVQKNTIFLLYATAMVLAAYYCENNLDWRVRPFTKAAFMLFVLFHLPMINLFTFLAYGKDKRSAPAWRMAHSRNPTAYDGIDGRHNRRNCRAKVFSSQK